jgi:putative membrane protein
MDAPTAEKRPAELRDYLAEERTFLAWIRTGLTLMGFGFVVARFGIFLQVMQVSRGATGATAPQSHGFSRWVGTMFVLVGVAVSVFSTGRHLRRVGEMNRGQVGPHSPSYEAVILAVFLALVGIAVALYVSLI